jgi:N6-L-threonylcarbamoyladenine synthase
LALIISGGHTQIVLFYDHGNYELIGQTRDDAVGEAFDKVAKILGLPYPGGPSISAAAKLGKPIYKLPKPKISSPFDFSFSGVKTATLRATQEAVGETYNFSSHLLAGLLTEQQKNDFAASFEKVAAEILTDKMLLAYEKYRPRSVVMAGGVAANTALRQELSSRLPINITFPPMNLCTDNAAMVASLGYFMSKKVAPTSPKNLQVLPSISMENTVWNR